MEKRFFIGIGIILFVLVLTYFVRINTDSLGLSEGVVSQNNSFGDDVIVLQKGGTSTSKSISENSSNKNDGLISLEELSKHNSENSCYVVYDSKVYDITSYLPRHPGGKNRILVNCGSSTSFEDAFVRQHGTSKVSLLMKVGTFIGDFDIVGRVN